MANVMKNREKGKKGWLRRLAERRVRMWLWKKMGPDGAESAYNVLKRYPVKKWPLTIKIIRGLERKKISPDRPSL